MSGPQPDSVFPEQIVLEYCELITRENLLDENTNQVRNDYGNGGDMAVDYNQVGWFEIPVSDMRRAIDFYEHVFGVTLDEHEMGELKMAWFPMKEDEIGAPGSLVKGEGCVPSDKGTLVYFSSADIEDACRKAVEKGGRVLQEKTSIGEYGFTAMLLDTEGNTLGLHSRT